MILKLLYDYSMNFYCDKNRSFDRKSYKRSIGEVLEGFVLVLGKFFVEHFKKNFNLQKYFLTFLQLYFKKIKPSLHDVTWKYLIFIFLSLAHVKHNLDPICIFLFHLRGFRMYNKNWISFNARHEKGKNAFSEGNWIGRGREQSLASFHDKLQRKIIIMALLPKAAHIFNFHKPPYINGELLLVGTGQLRREIY
jgi:hypothetical protein